MDGDLAKRHQEAKGSETQISFLLQFFREYRPIFVVLVADAAAFLLVLLALTGVRQLFSLLEKAGYTASDLLILERLHFWAVYAVLVVFMFDLVMKLVIGLFSARK
jgi:TRAP-type C4-dicarboxylate transport system permease small subunit